MLRLTSLLGECDREGAKQLAAWLGERIGETIEFIEDGDWSERLDAVRAGRIEIALVCGGVVADSPELVPLVAPVYQGQSGPVYWSELVVAADSPAQSWQQLAGQVVAINEPDSHSGVVHLKSHLRAAGCEHFFSRVLETGSHPASMIAVAQGQASCAAIDSHVWAREHADDDGLRVLARLGPSPSPPVAVHDTLAPDIARVIQESLARLNRAELKAALGIVEYRAVHRDHYLPLRESRALAQTFALA